MTSSLTLPRALAFVVPALLLGGALISQFVGGLYPCEMCMWQRWPHLAALILAMAALALRSRMGASAMLTALAAIAIGISGAIGAFHAGVEYHWWQGLTACSTTASATNAQDMLDSIMAAPLTRCDVAPWSLFGISLAGYNAIVSLGSALLILALLLRRKKEVA